MLKWARKGDVDEGRKGGKGGNNAGRGQLKPSQRTKGAPCAMAMATMAVIVNVSPRRIRPRKATCAISVFE